MIKSCVQGVLILCLTACSATFGNIKNLAIEPEPQERVYFVDDANREYVFDFKNSRSSLADSQSGVVLEDCTTPDFYCYRGDTVIASPKDCTELDLKSDWQISREVGLHFLGKDTQNEELYFQRVRSEKERSSKYIASDGMIFSEQRGVVGLWFSDELFPSIAHVSKIYRLTQQTEFLPCSQ